jgi:hypothetical protein
VHCCLYAYRTVHHHSLGRHLGDGRSAVLGMASMGRPLPPQPPLPLPLRQQRGSLKRESLRKRGGSLKRESVVLSTKGSGRTPFSRTADGRLRLREGAREALAGEALEALGIRASRVLALVRSGSAPPPPQKREGKEGGGGEEGAQVQKTETEAEQEQELERQQAQEPEPAQEPGAERGPEGSPAAATTTATGTATATATPATCVIVRAMRSAVRFGR